MQYLNPKHSRVFLCVREPTILMHAICYKPKNHSRGIFVSSHLHGLVQALHSLLVVRINHIIREINEELREATFRSSIVAED